MPANNIAAEETGPLEPRPLAAAQKHQASLVLAGAFHDDPLYRAIFPDPKERALTLQRLFGAVIAYTLRYGQVYTTTSIAGVACWLPPGNTRVTFWRMLRTGLHFQRFMVGLQAETRDQLLAALAYSDEIHNRLLAGPDSDAHYYLWALGVSPSAQGQGIGGQLIRPALDQAGRTGSLCYLETMNERSKRFYQRWGFTLRSTDIVPGTDVTVWAMIREPGR